ncbi:phosphoglucomutase/phosphomannomutase family protein [Prochlorococcus sp. MIT 1300]|uniref:phosphoglucomutase/phosphomannomutase family protein n=1 Tax=Prochlorococcus sp. MIT 1300 TaxID=3096218 RepID=UPI002A75160F|nr:phosphoglucomutase/phosphomannomutase family protein [Prochlorococcus sp. MIT 1300]
MLPTSLPLLPTPIRFGTDGWRGILGVDITLERFLVVAAAAAEELAYRAPKYCKSKTIIIGYDRRFLAREFAEVVAAAVSACELDPLLSETVVPTPACSWSVVQRKALGALVVTASHNPPHWLGLKIKGPFGGSVEGDFTKAVELRLSTGVVRHPSVVKIKSFDCRQEHLDGLKKKFDISRLAQGLEAMNLKVIVDPMHGSAAGCISDLFQDKGSDLIEEIRNSRDPLFGGYPPEPLAPYLNDLTKKVEAFKHSGEKVLGLVFDGDGDRIAAVDETGKFCSTQLLMPLLIDHLARVKNLSGSIIKTVSGSDLMRFVGEGLSREVFEMPVGFKYIASTMLSSNVLIGGEESGGIGFGIHLPERDALFAALLVLEAIVEGGQPLGERIQALQREYGGSSEFDRIDLKLENMNKKNKIETFLKENPPSEVAGKKVKEVTRVDGLKLRFGNSYWLMFRFSGTEPLLRIYCEAPTPTEVQEVLVWAKEFVLSL